MLGALAMLAGCSGNGNGDFPERQYIGLTRSESEVVNTGNGFAFDLYREVAKENDGKNLFLSPLSAQAALLMAANGAKGDTYDQIVKAIGFENYSADDVNSAFRKIIFGLQTVDTSVDFEFANSVWIKDGFNVKQDYVSLLADNFDAEASNVDFGTDAGVGKVNNWCSEKTHGMIPTIMDGPDDNLKLALINALYFKGQWSTKFDKSNTQENYFTAIDGSRNKIDFMNQAEEFLYSESEDMQVCELPFGNKAYAMDFLLPHKDLDFNEFFSDFTYDDLDEYLSAFGTAQVILMLPKLDLEDDVNLIPALSRLGIKDAFIYGTADFTDIHEPKELFIGIVRQKTALEMNEEGAKAAAVTSIGMYNDASPGPVDQAVFFADHPFLFLIREKSTGAILFIGAYTGK
jgi:serine protease inhibitor